MLLTPLPVRLSAFLAAVFLASGPARSEDIPMPDGRPLPAPAADEKPETPLDPARIASLAVEPQQVNLRSAGDYMQLLVTATLTDGTTADVTRFAVYDAGAVAAVSRFGRVVPRADGTGEIRIAAGAHRAVLPVTVSGTSQVAEPDYVRDVMPIVSKLGCNQGTCHGSKEGKNGFKLSLRGYDPVFDIRSLTDDLSGRRVNTAFPDSSLMLLKGSGAVPHEGGQVMTEDSHYYSVLQRWIANGAKVRLDSPRVTKIDVFPRDPVVQQIGARQQMRIVATYADGATRDVTSEAFIESGNLEVAKTDKKGLVSTLRRGEAAVLARFEGAYAATTVTVMGDRTGFTWEQPPANNEIDRLVAKKLERTKTSVAPLAGDLEFLRRIHLDLTGLPPTPDEIRAFLADPRDSRWKRDLLVQRLVGSDAFLDAWTNKWCDLLQVNSKFLAREGAEAFRAWIRAELAANTPYDQFARKILTATGSTKDNPPANYFKTLRKPEETMENTTHLWLATRFNCNKCHDHPFERWTQDQYYQMTAFFARTELEADPASGDRRIGGTAVEGATPLWEKVVDRKEGETIHLRTNAVTPPTFPVPVVHKVAKEATRREELAAWVTSPENPYFARSFVNRIWGYLLGTGIIEPLDDIRAGNPPSNPELLDWLTTDFVKSGFDFRHLVTTICQSRTYQLSLQSNRFNEDDAINFSHAKARRLPAEVLFDAIYAACGAKSRFPGMPAGMRAAALADSEVKTPDGFLGNLGKPARESTCECERSNELQLGPVMALISGPTVGDAISAPDNALAKLVKEVPDDHALIDEIFLRFLGRPATAAEKTTALETAAAMDREHERLAAAASSYEAELQPVIARQERERQAGIAALEKEQAGREAAIATQRAEMTAQREARIATAKTALAAAEAAVPGKVAAWEAAQKDRTGWSTLAFTEMRSSQRDTKLTAQDDGSLFVEGPDAKQTYTLAAPLNLPAMTGLRLEALTDDRLGGRGPGRSGMGNFVLSELEATWTPKGGAAVPVKFADAIATYNQGGYDVKSAIDGQTPGEPNGWAIHPGGIGKPQTAIFMTGAPFSLGGEGVLTLVFKQQYPDGKHTLGRFRVGVTNDPAPLGFGLPQPVTDVLATAAATRTPEQAKVLVDFLAAHDPDVAKHRAELAEAEKPLPPDAPLEEIKARLTRAREPLPVDPKLAQFRRDLELSAAQLADKRLIAAQDLAWALINNPAFLFNR